MSDLMLEFLDAIRDAGLEPPATVEPGKIHRFPGEGKSRKNQAGWCVLFQDGLGGCFGDFSTGLYKLWHPKAQGRLSRTDRLALRRQAAHTKERLEKERREKQAQAARRAVALWNDSLPATNLHPYLMRKGITAGIARIYKSALVLPVTDTRKRIISLQFIREDGSKRLLPGGRKKGGFIPVAGDLSMGQVIICEGWATGRTLAGDNPDALVLAAIDAGNLKRVALAICSCSPQAEIIIAGDDDRQTRGNPGVQKAMEAAHAIGGKAIFPSWPPNAPDDLTDFNDLAALWYEAEVAHD